MSHPASAPVASTGGVKGLVGGVIFLLAILLAVVFTYVTRDEKPTTHPATTTRVSTTTSPATTKATVLRFDGFTRCEPRIDFEFELDTQGDPITLQFPGVPTPIEYSGKGVLVAPTNRLSGPVIITSKKSHKQARVRIWEVVYIKGH